MTTNVEQVAAAYRLKLRELQRFTGDGVGTAMHAIKSVAHNAQEIEAREQGMRLQAEVVALARRAVPELAAAHFVAGQTKPQKIAEQIRKDFVDVALKGLPGASLYVSLSGFGQTPSSLRMRADADARFAAHRSALRADVEDIVTRAGADHPPKTRRERVEDWAKKSTPGGIVVGILFLSTLAAALDNCAQRVRAWSAAGSAGMAKPGDGGAGMAARPVDVHQGNVKAK